MQKTVTAVCLITIWSAIGASDYGVWFFELIVGLTGIAVLALTYRRFQFSGLIYLLICLHYAVLAVGAKYTYALVPLLDWLRDVLALTRNHFDRVGHFAQGFVPVLILRELLIRVVRVPRGRILPLICIGLALGFSALYELIEWWVVLLFYPDQGPEWLGMQGDIWDAQWDMFMALCGATLAILTLSKRHDRSMANLSTQV